MTEIPFMPGGSKFDPSNIGAFFKYALLKMNETYPFPPQIIKVDGTTIGTLGNFSASVGKPKSKKTFNLSAIVASALSGKMVLNYIVSLPTGKKRILYIDTEQSRPHCHRVLKRIIKMAQLPEGVEPQIDFLVLREFPPEQRRMIIDWSLQQRDDYSLVIVDGIRDLMRDINNPGEAIDVINDFMRWSSAYNLHIHTVLHLNKADDNTRGHIGTELNNKAETILQITKNAEYPNMSEVKAMHIRDREFTPFSFEIGDDSLPHKVSNYKENSEGRLTFSKLPEERHREALINAFGGEPIQGYNQLLSNIQRAYDSVGFKRGRNKVIEIVKHLQVRGVITKADRDYIYNPDVSIFPTGSDERTEV